MTRIFLIHVGASHACVTLKSILNFINGLEKLLANCVKYISELDSLRLYSILYSPRCIVHLACN